MTKQKTDIESYKQKLKSLESAASQRDDWINRISHYAIPSLYNYKYDNSSSRSNLPADVYDSEMVQAAMEFSNLFYSYLTNPATKWFVPTIGDEELMALPGVKDWLEIVQKKAFSTLLSTNFYSEIQSAYHSLTFGNCVIYREKDETDVLRYYTLPLSECYFEYDYKNRINSMYRVIKKTPLQILEEFPKTASKAIRDAVKNNTEHKTIKCLHVVRPRSQRDVTKKDKTNKKYESVYIDLENETILKEDGYDKFPFFVGHYLRDPHSPYSYGPGHLCLYDSKSLNQLLLSQLRRASKEADPVTNLPHDGYILPYLTDPGALNYRTTDDPKDKAEYMMPPPASSAVNDNLETMRNKIKRAFFVDLYRSIVDSTKRMTAYEVQQHLSDRAPMLGPAVWNLTTDFINHIIEDLIDELIERKDVPPLPESLSGKGYTIEYLSALAKSQKVNEINSMTQFLQLLGGAAQFDQGVPDNVDWDGWARQSADVSGLSQALILEENEVQEARTKKQEALAAARQKEELMAGASAMKDASQADKNLSEAGAKQ